MLMPTIKHYTANLNV